MSNEQIPWYLQPAFMPTHPQDLVLWLNSSSWDGTTWRNLAPSYSNVNHSMLMNGVAIGDRIHPSGVFGAPRKFDGINDYVDCGNDASLDITDAITIEAWVKWNDLSTGELIMKLAAFAIYKLNSGDVLSFATWGTSDAVLSLTNYGFQAGQWYHIVGTYNKDGGLNNKKIYINGVEEAQATITGSSSASIDMLRIGNIEAWVSVVPLNGSIDRVKIYNRALSASEVVHNHTHSPIYYIQHGIDPLSLLSQTPQEAAHVVV